MKPFNAFGYEFIDVVDDGKGRSCFHCGTGIRYVAKFKSLTDGKIIGIGSDCLVKAGFWNPAIEKEFAKAKKQAKERKEQIKKSELKKQFVEANPVITALLEYDKKCQVKDGTPVFLSSLVYQFERNGYLSQKQVDAILPAIEKAEKAKAQKQEKELEREQIIISGVKAPQGKANIKGEVLGFKDQVSNYGTTVKMLIKCQEGYTVYVTCPSGLNCKKGDIVELTAIFQRSQDDELFAWGKNPSKAQILQTAKVCA